MKTFQEIAIQEDFKYTGKLKPYQVLLFTAYTEFLQDYFETNITLKISFRKPKKDYFGDVDLNKLKKKNYTITMENTPYGILGRIGHEFTHISQYLKGELNTSDNKKFITWKGEDYISIEDYNNIKDMPTYKALPWETEAYSNQEKIPVLFKKSKSLKNILGQNTTLDFGVENDLWF